MALIKINGKEFQAEPGIKLLQFCLDNKIDVPYFCYHPSLSIVATCRMCLVEQVGVPKLQASCSLPITDKMEILTESVKVKEARDSALEFLLINHPLDCPICDKAGECKLQDQTFKYTKAGTRFEEVKRRFAPYAISDKLVLDMNRCILCTRCVRFSQEVAKSYEFGVLERGNISEVGVLDDKHPLTHAYQGNMSDVCPVGCLTLKNFRFKKRVWFLKKTESICPLCTRGCNVTIETNQNKYYRIMPRFNKEINNHWICDEGRLGMDPLQNNDRLLTPKIKINDSLFSTSWEDAIKFTKDKLQKTKDVGFVISSWGSLEENKILESQATIFNSPVYSWKTEDSDQDTILRRTNKSPNAMGLKEVKTISLDPQTLKPTDIKENVLFILNQRNLTITKNLKDSLQNKFIVVFGFFENELTKLSDIVFPIPSLMEKAGAFINFQGKKQFFKKAINPDKNLKELTEIYQLIFA